MRRDYSDFAAMFQAAINPLAAKLQVLEDKVDKLSQDRVTRSDIEKLSLTFVQRDMYEARHAVLVDRDKDLEADMRDLRKDCEDDFQKIHERLESGKQQIEDRLRQQQDVSLSNKDRAWVRWSQIIGFAGIILAILDWLSQHIHLN